MTRSSLRHTLSLYGVLLGMTSLWIMLAELSRPDVTGLPTSAELAAKAATHRDGALWAARFGIVRGELWAELAFAYAGRVWAGSSDVQTRSLEQATASAARAVSLLPVNSAVWLLLADLASRNGRQAPNPIETLKMSYYTGPHEQALIPLRLNVAAQAKVTDDPEFERLFRRDIETVLTYRPALRPALLTAYGLATPQARRTIEDTAKRVDPTFAQTLRAGIPH